MKLAVVILNWNGVALLELFLPSVVLHSEEADVYVIDNASTDASIFYIEKNFPQVTIIRLIENLGYAGGYNEGLKHIKADVYCLLNNDVEVTKNWLAPIITEFEKHPSTAVAQPKLLDYKQRNRFEYAGAAGGFLDKFGYPYCRGRIFNSIEEDKGQYNDTIDIFWASGACFFVRSEVFHQYGGFDSAFFAHMEEIDLCWRLFNSGYTIKYIGSSTVYHLGGGTLKNIHPKKTYLNFRNSLFTLTKNARGNVLFLIFISLILDGLAALRFLFKIQFWHIWSILQAHINFYLNFRKFYQLRKNTKTKRKYFITNSIVWNYFVLRQKYFQNYRY